MHPPEHWMRLAVTEARKGLGFTAPNPAVGAVVVKDDQLLGKGYHARAGEPHAEPMALRDAGAAARCADLYVTLEPCCTHGKTPPCTEAIKAAGIHRVFIGTTDPNPAHAGRAYAILREAGIEVMEDVLADSCRDLLRAFAHVQTTGLPYVSLKLATSLDGRIADATGTSQWITGPESRERVQSLRREADAILVGTETLRLDNPSLQPRPAEGHRPWRIVPDRTGSLPLSLKVFTDEFQDRTLCLLGADAPQARRAELDAAGMTWIDVPLNGGVFDWADALRQLKERSIHHILCEGGGRLAAALLQGGFVQEIFWFQAPMLLGQSGRPALAMDVAFSQAPRFTRVELETLGTDLFARYQPI
jgi:diaminohydroxyphosphoribosylaminopyrimidine deaminase/5-amino-6-(5-phosphoribosylamino)uracil reductase